MFACRLPHCLIICCVMLFCPSQCLLFLEKELSTLGSMCAASLLNEDTVLPFAGKLRIPIPSSSMHDSPPISFFVGETSHVN